MVEFIYWSPGSSGRTTNQLDHDYMIIVDIENKTATLIEKSLSRLDDGFQPTHKHFKGRYYRVTNNKRLFVDGDQPEPLVEYQDSNGNLYARTMKNFNEEGRFEEVHRN
jgi:hypothetical protein